VNAFAFAELMFAQLAGEVGTSSACGVVQTAELVENALPKDLVEATKRDLQIFVTTVTDESAKGIAHTAEKFNHDFHLKDIEGSVAVM
jgi:hypothetical protein